MAVRRRVFHTVLAAFVVAAPAHAHVSFVRRQVPVDRTIEATLRVPHGCSGSPTIRLRIRLPAAVLAVRPAAKDGWAVLQAGEGASREIAWTGRLPDKERGEFSFSMDLDPSVKPGQVIYFPVVQECEKGVARWIDIQGRPSADAPDTEEHDENSSPAPSVRLTPRK